MSDMPPPTVPHPSQMPPPTPARATQRWEYTTAVIAQTLFTGKQKAASMQQTLAQHGAQGWELTGVVPGANMKGQRDGIVLFFKRPA